MPVIMGVRGHWLAVQANIPNFCVKKIFGDKKNWISKGKFFIIQQLKL